MDWTIYIISGAFVLTGILVGTKACRTVIQARKSTRWPKTDGMVTLSELKTHQDREGGNCFSCQIAYTYQVGGISYVGDAIRMGMISSGSKQYSESFVSKYKPGDHVSVFYDPEKPATAVIEPGLYHQAFSNLVVGGVFLVAGILTAIHYWRART